MIIFKIKYYLVRILLYLFVLPKKGYGAEIGVWRGGNAKLLYYLTRPHYLYLIDRYQEYGLYSLLEISKMIEGVNVWCESKRAKLFLMDSAMASTLFTSGRFSYIYIDANHSDLYNDLTYWFHKVKPGGIIMGDDYSDQWPDIKKDLVRFCNERNLTYKTLHCQWWIRK